MRSYWGRLIGVVSVVVLITMWNVIFYRFSDHPFLFYQDISIILLVLIMGYFLGSLYDRNHRSLKRLRMSEENYKRLNEEMKHVLENVQEVVFHTDNKGNFRYLNQSWESFSGYTVNESLDRNSWHFLSLKERHEVKPIIRDCISNKIEKQKLDFKYKKKDGSVFWCEVNIKFFYNHQGFIGAVGTLSDITDRVHLEEELLEMNETLAMESQKFAVAGQLAAGIAHEVRNPLTSINGFLQLISDSEDGKKEEYLGIVFSEIKRIEQVLNELLILAKPQAISHTDFNIIEVFDQVSKLLTTNAILYNVTIEKDFPSEPIYIKGDENQLKQVFINLIKNAIEASTFGGIIRLGIKKEKYRLVLSFEDEGVGMSKETLKKLWDPFYTTKASGTGLGLSICLRILKDHNATVRVHSEEGVGTGFYISFQAIDQDRSFSENDIVEMN